MKKMLTTKTCSRCKTTKPRDLENFPPHNKCKDGLDSWCRDCRREYRNANLRGNYRGMISDAALKELRKQKNCSICGKEGKLVVDHSHDKNVVRGMLCQTCNRGIGNFYDNVSYLEAAIRYLNETNTDSRTWEHLVR